MELTKTEVAVLQDAVKTASDDQICQLNDLQLAFVGGGIAELVGG